MQSNLMRRGADWIVDHPRWNVLFLAIVTFLAALCYYNPRWFILAPAAQVAEDAQANNQQPQPAPTPPPSPRRRSLPLATASRLGRNLHIGHDRSIIDRNLSKVGILIDFVIRRARFVS